MIRLSGLATNFDKDEATNLCRTAVEEPNDTTITKPVITKEEGEAHTQHSKDATAQHRNEETENRLL